MSEHQIAGVARELPLAGFAARGQIATAFLVRRVERASLFSRENSTKPGFLTVRQSWMSRGTVTAKGGEARCVGLESCPLPNGAESRLRRLGRSQTSRRTDAGRKKPQCHEENRSDRQAVQAG
jgi:hypothetical protein